MSDNGAAITGDAMQAFNYFGERGQIKRWTMARPIFSAQGSIVAGVGLNVDFDLTAPSTTVPISASSAALWASGPSWTAPTYWGGAASISKRWVGLGGVGYCAAPRVRITGRNVVAQWQATDMLYEPGGLAF
jgi:hypothetical protein